MLKGVAFWTGAEEQAVSPLSATSKTMAKMLAQNRDAT